MTLTQLVLYRNNYVKGVVVYVVVLESHPKEGYFSVTPYYGLLEVWAFKGIHGLRKGKSQKHVGRFSALTAFDECVQRVIHKQHYTCARDGIYRPTEDAPLAVDITRATRIKRSQSRVRRSIISPSPILTRKRRLLEFSNS